MKLTTGFVDIAGPVRIFYRDTGAGLALVFLHGGWGYEVYPFDSAIEALSGRFRILIPDRSGYGRSTPIVNLPADFHGRAALETARFLDALNIERAVLWGHSDGAVIAALLALDAPSRFAGVIFEAFHYAKSKTGSLDFFRAMISDPDTVGDRASTALASDHGEQWRKVLDRNATAWLQIVQSGSGDLYGGRLSELQLAALFINGGRDPRTEPGDLEAIRRQLPQAEIRIIENAGHSPHSERESADVCVRIAAEFLDRISATDESAGKN
jgi:pimeloyl-ACP methyl ester carboxylesterase